MNVQEVLGIDLSQDRLCVVELRLGDGGGAGPVLTHRAQADIPPGADASEIASILRRTLSDGDFGVCACVLGLPPGSGFLQTRRFSGPARGDGQGEHETLGDLDYVIDTWSAGDGRSVRGVASRADVTRMLQIASQASLEPLAVELRSMGYLTALGLLEVRRPDSAPAAVGLIIDEGCITGALTDRQAPLVVYTRTRTPSDTGVIDRLQGLQADVERMLRTIRMGHPEVFGESAGTASPDKGDSGDVARDEQRPPVAASVRVIAGGEDRRALAGIGDRLGLAIETVDPGQSAGLRCESDFPGDGARYAAAIGLALEGLQPHGKLSPAAFNFLRPTRAKRRGRGLPALSWRAVALAAAAVAAILAATAITIAWHKHNVLTDLERQYERRAPELHRRQEAIGRWRMLRPWVGQAGGGSRIDSGRIYEAITQLFPSSDDVYITRLSLLRDQDSAGVSIRLEGRAQATAELFEFVSRLNGSKRFERARLGSVTDVADASSYPKRFAITLNLREDR